MAPARAPSRLTDEISAAAGADAVLGRLPLVYFDHGYDAGYRQAVADLLQALLPLSEQFIDAHPGRREDLCGTLYPFEHFLEQRIARMTPDAALVEGGLGI
jgi:hypothetical protein